MSIIYDNKTINKGLSNSEAFNNFANSIMQDIIDTASNVTSTEINVENVTAYINYENRFLKNKIKSLQSLLSEIKDTQNSIIDKTNFRYISKMIGDSGITSLGCTVNQNYSTITPLVVKEYSRTNLDGIYNPNNKIRIYESKDNSNWVLKYSEQDTTELFNIIDGSYEKMFATTAKTTDLNVQKIYIKVQIDYDLYTINNLQTNTIKIDAIPTYSLNLLSVKFKNTSGEYVLVSTYPKSGNQPTKLTGISPMYITFPSVEATGVELIFENDDPIQEQTSSGQNINTFFYGFKEISVSYAEYQTSNSKIEFNIGLPASYKMFSYIATPIPVISPCNPNNFNIQYQLYIQYGNTWTEVEFNKNLPSPTHNIKVVANILNSGEYIPVLNGIKIKYKTE